MVTTASDLLAEGVVQRLRRQISWRWCQVIDDVRLPIFVCGGAGEEASGL